jgi:hypothetical protein
MTTFNWAILSMTAYPEAEGQTDVVFQVDWQCSAKDEHFGATSTGSVDVNYVSGEPFTAYEDLTEDQVWGWINPNIDKTSVEADLQTTLNAQASPSKETKPLPW